MPRRAFLLGSDRSRDLGSFNLPDLRNTVSNATREVSHGVARAASGHG